MVAPLVRTRRRRSAGYTLVELIAVVAMIGVLAALAIVGYRRWLRSARTAETKDIIQNLSLGQERHYRDTEGYLSCSSGYTDYYPMAPNRKKHLFHNPSHSAYACFKALNADAGASTYMSFAVIAAEPGQALPAPPTKQPLPDPPAHKPWYVIFAAGDQDENGIYQYMWSTSLAPGEVHVENDAE